MGLQQGFATGEMGLGVSLHGSNPDPLMSALGQKRTFPNVQPMSALPPKADVRPCNWHVRFVPKADMRGDFLNLGVTRRNGRGVVMGTQVIGVV